MTEPTAPAVPARHVNRGQLVPHPRTENQVKDAVRTLNRKLTKLISWRGIPTTLYTLTATLEDSPEDLTNGGYPLVIAIRLAEPDRTMTDQPETVWAETFHDVNQSAVALYRHGKAVYSMGMGAAIARTLKVNAINVTYDGSGWWLVKGQDGVNLGRLRQGITQAWSAWTLDGVRLQINGHDESGTSAQPVLIARTMVPWPNY